MFCRKEKTDEVKVQKQLLGMKKCRKQENTEKWLGALKSKWSLEIEEETEVIRKQAALEDTI